MTTNDDPIKIVEVMEQARAAEAQGNWAEALRLWGVVYERAPHRPVAILGLTQSLVALGRIADADMALEEGTRRFPDNARIAIEHAELAQKRSEFELAARRWQGVRSRFPNRPRVLAQVGTALSSMGRFAEADALLAKGATSFPKNEQIAVAYAISAQRRGDAAEALKRWQAVLVRFPDHIEAQAGIDFARRELKTIEEAQRLVALSRPALDPARMENAAIETSGIVPAPTLAAGDDEESASSVEALARQRVPGLASGGAQRMMARDNNSEDGESAQANSLMHARRHTARAGMENEGFVRRVQRAIRGVLGGT